MYIYIYGDIIILVLASVLFWRPLPYAWPFGDLGVYGLGFWGSGT